MNEILHEIYYNPSHPASFGGVNNLYKYAKLEDPNIKLNNVLNWLKQQNVYTLHRPARKHFTRNRIYVSQIDEQWEADLVDMQEHSRENNGYKYLLVIIDVFSKYLFLNPLRNKTPIEVINVFRRIFRQRKPLKLRTDRGKEFDNILFRRFCKQNHVIFFTTQNRDVKCAVVERVNRTIKSKMNKYFTSVGNHRYIEYLPQIVKSYNNNIHRSTKMAPEDISEVDEPMVFENLYNTKNLLSLVDDNKRPKLNIGDQVRQKLDLSVLDKSYYPLWTNMVYKVGEIHNKLNKPQYSLEIDGNRLNRRFYPEEIQQVLVNDETEWHFERIIAYRTRNGQRQARVKWRGYPAQYNQWIPVEQIRNL